LLFAHFSISIKLKFIAWRSSGESTPRRTSVDFSYPRVIVCGALAAHMYALHISKPSFVSIGFVVWVLGFGFGFGLDICILWLCSHIEGHKNGPRNTKLE